MTELDRIQQAFDEVGIKYTMEYREDEITMYINFYHVEQSCNNSLDIVFNKDETFKFFRALGE